MESIEEAVQLLPLELRQEALDFIHFLVEKNRKRMGGKLTLSWAGGLREYRDDYTSLDLQKKALEWWGD
jgi:hypothetical protein